jgi:hypothetical protein
VVTSLQSLLIASALVSLMSASVAAQNPSGSEIAKRTRTALEPRVPSTRLLTITINQGAKRTAQWTGAQARATENGVHYLVAAVFSPAQVKL